MPRKVYIIMSVRHAPGCSKGQAVLNRVGDGRRGLKGQAVFEFVIATLFFLAIIIYTINYLNSTVFLFSGEYRTNSLESRAWQVSEILVRSPGQWSGLSPNMVPSEMGLAEDWPLLSEDKIESLDNWCQANMDEMMLLLDVDPRYHGIRLEVNKTLDVGEMTILECGSPPRGIQSAKVTRFGIGDGVNRRLLKVRVWYW
jgi:hypothetical protein